MSRGEDPGYPEDRGDVIVLGVTATGLIVLLPRKAFGTAHARSALVVVRGTMGRLPTRQLRRGRPDRRGTWTRRA